MPTYAAGAGRVRARRGRAALGLRGQGVPRLLRRALGPQRRPLPPARSSRRSASRRRRSPGRRTSIYSEPALRLAERLVESSLGGKAFLCNSGAEANECAIKLARKHAHGAGSTRPRSSSSSSAFHGRTLGALAATPRLARDDLFGPLPPGFVAGAARRPRGAARGGRRAHRGGDARADPGRGRGLPDRRRGARSRRARRATSRRAAGLRRGPDRDGADRDRSGPTSSCRYART